MECFENIMEKYLTSTLNELFPKDTKNKIPVYTLGIIHIIGALYIYHGIYTPPEYMHLYILFLITVVISYFMLNEKCFVNHLVFKLRDQKNSNSLQAGSREEDTCVDSKMTHLKMRTIYSIICILLLLSFMSLLDKRFHLVAIQQKMHSYFANINPLFHYLPLGTLYTCLLFYFGIKLFK